MKKSDRLTASFYRGNRVAFCIVLAATAAISSINLFLAWLMQQMIDTASGVEGAYSLGMLLLFTVAVLALIILFKSINAVARPAFFRRAMTQYKQDAFLRLTRKSIAAFSRESSSAYLTALSADSSTIEQSYLDVTFDLLFDLILMIGALGMMLLYSPLLTAVALGLFLLPIGVSLLTGGRMKHAEQAVSSRHTHFLGTLGDCLNGFSVIKSYRAEQTMEEVFASSSRALEDAKYHRLRLKDILSMLGGVAGVTAQFGTFLAGIALAAVGFGITPGILLVFIDLTGNVIRPIEVLPGRIASRRAARALIDKLEGMLGQNLHDEGIAIPAALDAGITFAGVSFGYSPDAEVLHGIDFTFAAGKSYAIVGPSGSGKSTLLSLLMAGHGDYCGSIRYDGHELREIDPASLYDAVSLIGQNVFLFNDTIENNITLYRDFSPDEVRSAIARAGLSALIAERGGNLCCGEQGCNLSGGEKQRIAIARALLRRTPVLLCDEITSALDAETARQISDAILRQQDLTRITVTHALDADLLRRYHTILVLKDGRIVESGDYDTLMEKRGELYALAAHG